MLTPTETPANPDPRDINTPYYYFDADTPTSGAVKPLLTGIDDYPSWRRIFCLSLSIKNKMGFIDGFITMPAPDSHLYFPWLRNNNLILLWILNSVSDDIKSTISLSGTAKEVWDRLGVRYGQPDEVRIYQLVRNTAQESRTVREYFIQLRDIWEELDMRRPLPHCSCESSCVCKVALPSFAEDQNCDRVFQFLRGLNEEFDAIRGKIIRMSPFPSLDQACALVIQEEARIKSARVKKEPHEEIAYCFIVTEARKDRIPKKSKGSKRGASQANQHNKITGDFLGQGDWNC